MITTLLRPVGLLRILNREEGGQKQDYVLISACILLALAAVLLVGRYVGEFLVNLLVDVINSFAP